MAQKIGSVKIPGGSIPYDIYWDPGSGKVKVGSELAGTASTKEDAIHVADYYASTNQQKFLK
jgi:hypothetical protein